MVFLGHFLEPTTWCFLLLTWEFRGQDRLGRNHQCHGGAVGSRRLPLESGKRHSAGGGVFWWFFLVLENGSQKMEKTILEKNPHFLNHFFFSNFWRLKLLKRSPYWRQTKILKQPWSCTQWQGMSWNGSTKRKSSAKKKPSRPLRQSCRASKSHFLEVVENKQMWPKILSVPN